MFGYQTSRKDAKFVDQHDATIICFCQGSIEFPGVNNVIIHRTISMEQKLISELVLGRLLKKMGRLLKKMGRL